MQTVGHFINAERQVETSRTQPVCNPAIGEASKQVASAAKNDATVMPGADLDNVANSLQGEAFGSSGERCVALSVVVAY